MRWNFASTEDRFWSHVDKSGNCWLWTAARDWHGYGSFRFPDRCVKAHRFSYELHFGPIPPGMFVCHHCDNPPCVRPDHIFVGTQSDNMRDASQKGRLPAGETHHLRVHPEWAARGDRNGARVHRDRMQRGESRWNAKLTETAVREIRQLYSAGNVSMGTLAHEYGITPSSIHAIIHRIAWVHVSG